MGHHYHKKAFFSSERNWPSTGKLLKRRIHFFEVQIPSSPFIQSTFYDAQCIPLRVSGDLKGGLNYAEFLYYDKVYRLFDKSHGATPSSPKTGLLFF